jgi:hypothetical protein
MQIESAISARMVKEVVAFDEFGIPGQKDG